MPVDAADQPVGASAPASEESNSELAALLAGLDALVAGDFSARLQPRDGLMGQGWRPAHAPASSGASWQTWRRGTETLVVDVLGKAEGSVLAVLRFASDPYAAPQGFASGDAP